MPRKPENEYDIILIQELENIGLSIREIARINGWPEGPTGAWIRRNYTREVDIKVKYIKKENL